jgi:hypothetical protein
VCAPKRLRSAAMHLRGGGAVEIHEIKVVSSALVVARCMEPELGFPVVMRSGVFADLNLQAMTKIGLQDFLQTTRRKDARLVVIKKPKKGYPSADTKCMSKWAMLGE